MTSMPITESPARRRVLTTLVSRGSSLRSRPHRVEWTSIMRIIVFLVSSLVLFVGAHSQGAAQEKEQTPDIEKRMRLDSILQHCEALSDEKAKGASVAVIGVLR